MRALCRANLGLLRAIIKEKRSAIDKLEFELYLLHMELAKALHPVLWNKVDILTFVEASVQRKSKKKHLVNKRWSMVHMNNAVPVAKGGPVKVVKARRTSIIKGSYSADELKSLGKKTFDLKEGTKSKLRAAGIYKEGQVEGRFDPFKVGKVAPPLGKALVNLTNVKLTDQQVALLEKGPKFALGPRKSDGSLLAAQVEKALMDVPEAEKTLVKANIVGQCRSMKMWRSCHWATLRSIKELDVVVLKADKGETVVLMEKDEFLRKVQKELSSTTYKKLEKDPTRQTCIKLGRMIGGFRSQELNNCKVPNPESPRLFCQVKLHKEGRPLRLIVSGVNSPVSRLEKAIAKVLGKYAYLNSSSIKNSEHLVQLLRTIKPPGDDECLFSLDIVQLFPSLPREETLEAINCAMANDGEVSSTLREDVIQAVTFIFDHSFFRFGNQYYHQTKGSPIGSSLSPVIAEIYLVSHEAKAKALLNIWPRFFVRYVDDHLVISNSDSVNELVQVLNSINTDVKFTVEEAINGQISFLDVSINVRQGLFQTSVFRKPTSSGILINKESMHHPAHKMCSWKTLVHRAFTICSDEYTLQSELMYLKELAALNGFSPGVVEEAVRQRHIKERRKRNSTLIPCGDVDLRSVAVLPHLGKISEMIGKMIRNVTNKRVAYQPLNKLGVCLFNSKEPQLKEESSGIYKVPCRCGSVYIGKTTRNFSKRLEEHKAALRNFQPNASAIARHFWLRGCDKGIDWDSSRVWLPNKYPPILGIREALEIALEKNRYSNNLMNDQEQLGKYHIWKLLEGTWLFPTGTKYTDVSDNTKTSVSVPTEGHKRSHKTSEGKQEKGAIPVRRISVLQKVREDKEGDSSDSPAEKEKGRPMLRPRKGR